MATKSKKTVEKLEETLNAESSLVDNAEQLELLIERVRKAQNFMQLFPKNKLTRFLKLRLQLQIKLVFRLPEWQ